MFLDQSYSTPRDFDSSHLQYMALMHIFLQPEAVHSYDLDEFSDSFARAAFQAAKAGRGEELKTLFSVPQDQPLVEGIIRNAKRRSITKNLEIEGAKLSNSRVTQDPDATKTKALDSIERLRGLLGRC